MSGGPGAGWRGGALAGARARSPLQARAAGAPTHRALPPCAPRRRDSAAPVGGLPLYVPLYLELLALREQQQSEAQGQQQRRRRQTVLERQQQQQGEQRAVAAAAAAVAASAAANPAARAPPGPLAAAMGGAGPAR